MFRKGGTSCVVRGCFTKTGENTSLFRIPEDSTRAACWLRLCNREDLLGKSIHALHRNFRVCEKHFAKEVISQSGIRKHLFQNAVPSIFPHSAINHTLGVILDDNCEGPPKKIAVLDETEPDTFCKEEDEVVGESEFFNHDESLQLIKAYGKHEHLFKIISSNESVWNLISADLDCEGIQKKPKECETKWKNLVKAYRTHVKDKVGSSKFKFVNEMEAIFKTEEESLEDEIEEIKIEYDETANENEIVSNNDDFWSFSETSALVEAYGHHRKSFAKDGHELQTWSRISTELSSNNIHRSPESCKRKWESLVQKHNGGKTNYEFHNKSDDVTNAQDEESVEQSSKRHKGDCECYKRKIFEKQKRHQERMDVMKRKLDIEERKLAAFEKYVAHLSTGKE